jgi:hypothetical protein
LTISATYAKSVRGSKETTIYRHCSQSTDREITSLKQLARGLQLTICYHHCQIVWLKLRKIEYNLPVSETEENAYFSPNFCKCNTMAKNQRRYILLGTPKYMNGIEQGAIQYG